MVKPWGEHKHPMHSLYFEQGQSLDKLMDTMRKEHGFIASERTYRLQFKKWGWYKYSKNKARYTHSPQDLEEETSTQAQDITSPGREIPETGRPASENTSDRDVGGKASRTYGWQFREGHWYKVLDEEIKTGTQQITTPKRPMPEPRNLSNKSTLGWDAGAGDSETDDSGSRPMTDFCDEDLLPPDHFLQSMLPDVSRDGLKSFWRWHPEVKDAVSHHRTSQKGTMKATDSATGQSSLRRKRGGNDETDGEDDKEHGGGKRQKRSSSRTDLMDAGQPLFACCFYKRNGVKYADCVRRSTWKRVRDVKYHMIRKHMKPLYCFVCNEVFDRDGDRIDHMRSRVCADGTYPEPEGISEEQRQRLDQRLEKRKTQAEQWFGLWDILFPGQPRPLSPYPQGIIPEVATMFRAHWRRHGDQIAASHLAGHPALSWQNPNEERDLRSFVATAFQRILDELIDQVQSAAAIADKVDDVSSDLNTNTLLNGPAVRHPINPQPESRSATGPQSNTDSAHRGHELSREECMKSTGSRSQDQSELKGQPLSEK
ncbi:uncharacterized protein MKZ38_010227 [Zalerion maritima]|uniref:Clr5 domain-containing protein n=1 Tax=Zalerion maritima TaxID=339359 RepID=A0AAD5RFI9_9PEZI|nr:uncharacterized protein MKZ38_010227 [Zalerion maritima]